MVQSAPVLASPEKEGAREMLRRLKGRLSGEYRRITRRQGTRLSQPCRARLLCSGRQRGPRRPAHSHRLTSGGGVDRRPARRASGRRDSRPPASRRAGCLGLRIDVRRRPCRSGSLGPYQQLARDLRCRFASAVADSHPPCCHLLRVIGVLLVLWRRGSCCNVAVSPA